jgi:hypothetical protein
MKIIKYSLICFALMTAISSCEKDEYDPQLLDIRPPIPVTVSNYTDLRPGFTVRASRATNTFKFDLEIPANSGRTIKEITKVVTAAGPNGLFTSAPNYAAGPVAGNGTNKITFNTSITEWDAKNPPLPPSTVSRIPANNPPINAVELPTQYFFLITLDDNSTLVTEPIRVLLVP